MSEKYKFANPEGVYFVSPTITNWIDLFTRKEYCEIILDSLKFCCEKKGLILHAWCIMPSHLHLIISAQQRHLLSDIMRDFKKFTSVKIIDEINNINESRRKWLLSLFAEAGKNLKRIKKYKVWQDGNHPVEMDTNQIIDQKLDYLHNNPVEAGIVNERSDYRWSSAVDYNGGKGLLKIKKIE